MSSSTDFESVVLSDEEKKYLEQHMASAVSALSEAANANYGFANIKKLRTDYKKGLIQLDDETRLKMDWMIAHESRIIAGYIRLVNKIYLKFNRFGSNTGATVNDYLQEGALAIYDAMYEYNGSSKFTTFVYCFIRNRLVDFNRRENKNRKVENSINKLSSQIYDMKACGVSCERAVKQINSDDEFDEDVIDWLKSSAKPATTALTGESKEMWDAVENAPLTVMERNLVEAHLRGDHSYRSKLSETINENTGKLWTRQRLSQIFIVACDKIRTTYALNNRAVA